MALPNGRILGEVMPLLQRIGIEPEPAFADPKKPGAFRAFKVRVGRDVPLGIYDVRVVGCQA